MEIKDSVDVAVTLRHVYVGGVVPWILQWACIRGISLYMNVTRNWLRGIP